METDRISKGDKVDVYFECTPCLFNVEVLYIPAATGDSWVLRDEGGGIHHVQMFTRMSRKEAP